MNKEQIREQYLNEIEASIQNAEKWADTPRFDLFLNMSMDRKYSWFNHGRYSGGIAGTTEAMDEFKYNIEDDGQIVAVWFTREYTFMGRLQTKEDFVILPFIICDNWNYLEDDITKSMNKVNPCYFKYELKEYYVRNFDWEFFDFLMNIEQEFKETVDVITNSEDFIKSKRETIINWKHAEAVCLNKIKEFVLAKEVKK